MGSVLAQDPISDGHDGLLVPPSAAAEALGRALATVAAEPARAVRFGAASRRAIEARFELAAHAARLAAIRRRAGLRAGREGR